MDKINYIGIKGNKYIYIYSYMKIYFNLFLICLDIIRFNNYLFLLLNNSKKASSILPLLFFKQFKMSKISNLF